jgi:hypothetical protein
MNLEEKSNALIAHDIQLGDLWNIMKKFSLDTVEDAIEHCFIRVSNNKCIWS